MATPTIGDSEFVLGWCADCERRVLPYVELGEDGAEVYRCLHCDSATLEEMSGASAAEIEEAGYGVVEARVCGNGGGCSSGCGSRGERNPKSPER